MIGSTLDFIAQELNSTICQRLSINPSAVNKVVLSSIIDPDGSITVKEKNVLLLKLINIEMDPMANGPQPTAQTSINGNIVVETSPIYLNLKIVLAAHFSPEQIKSGLDLLTMGISYLQGKPSWVPQNTPGLPTGTHKLFFEMETLDMHQISHLWGAIGVKYMPSVVYKLKMLTIDDHAIQAVIPEIQTIDTSVKN